MTRNDRKVGLGMGSEIYLRGEFPMKTRNDRPDPVSLSKIFVACVCLPPSMDGVSLEKFNEYFHFCYDLVASWLIA